MQHRRPRVIRLRPAPIDRAASWAAAGRGHRAACRLLHLQDVLAERILRATHMSINGLFHILRLAYLLAPVLQTLLTLRRTVLLVDDV